MPAYKVMRKAHRRTSRVVGAGGVINAGVATTYFPGDVIEDLTPLELQAFPDRFTPATEDEVKAFKQRQQQLAEPFIGTPDPHEHLSALEQKMKLEQQIADLQRQLSALPLAEPDKALREHAPVDPVTQERHAREQEAIRQVTQEQARQEQAQQMPPPPAQAKQASRQSAEADTNAAGGRRSESNKADAEDGPEGSRSRR